MSHRADNPESLDRALLEQLLSALELDGERRDAAVADLCAQHPDQADALRRHAERGLSSDAFPYRDFLERLIREPGASERYETRTEIGRGGMATVFRVRDRDLDRFVAMKVIRRPGRPEATPSLESQELQRFVDEAQITGQLDHPGVVPVYQIGANEADGVWFTMRLVRGRTVDEVIALAREHRDGWSTTRALEVIVKVCDTLAFAHSRQVVHRDLKPSNVMVGRFGEVYVMDWGLARVLSEEDRRDLRIRPLEGSRSRVVTSRSREVESDPDSPLVTMDGTVVGTPSYMSLEQAEGRVVDLGPRSDVYSVGAILYTLLTGTAPYVTPGQIRSPHTLLHAVLEGPPQPVRASHQVPAELVSICEKAMSRTIADRYEDCRAMADDIRAYLEGRVVRAHKTGAIVEMRMWLRRNRAFALAAGAAFVLLALGAVAAVVAANAEERARIEGGLRADAESARSVAEQAKRDVEFARDRTRYTRRLLEAEFALETDVPRARRALDACEEVMRGPEWHALRFQADSSSWRARTPDGELPRGMQFGTTLSGRVFGLLTVGEEWVHVWAPPSTAPAASFRHPGGVIDQVAVSPQLTHVVCGGGGLVAVWAQDDPEPLMTAESDSFHANEDCQLVAYKRGRTLTLWDGRADTRFRTRRYEFDGSARDYLSQVAPQERSFARQLRLDRTDRVFAAGCEASADGSAIRLHRTRQVGGTTHSWRGDPAKMKFPEPESITELRCTLLGHDTTVGRMASSPDDRWLLSASLDGSLRLWAVEPLAQNRGLLAERLRLPILSRAPDWHDVATLKVSPSGRRAVTVSQEQGVWVWDLEQREPFDVVRGVFGLRGLDFLDDETVVVASDDGIVRTLDCTDAAVLEASAIVIPGLDRLAVAGRGGRVFASTISNRVVGFAVANAERVLDVAAPERPSALASSPDGTSIVWTAGGNRVWRCRVDDAVVESKTFDVQVSRLAIDTERGLLAAAGGGVVHLLNLDDLSPFRVFDVGGPPRSMVFSHRGLTLLTVRPDGEASWWSTTGEVNAIARLRLGAGTEQLSIRDGGRVLWGVDAGGDLRRWDFAPEYEHPPDLRALERAKRLLAEYGDLVTARQRTQSLDADTRLPGDLRRAALRLARIDGDDVDRLEARCWSIVRDPARDRTQYEQALLIAQQLTRQFRDIAVYTTDLGLSHYRLEQWRDALSAFERARQLELLRSRREDLVNLGLRALTLARVGRAAEASAAARAFGPAASRLEAKELQRELAFGARGRLESNVRFGHVVDELRRGLVRVR